MQDPSNPKRGTLRDNLLQAEKVSGKKPKRLLGPEFPIELAYIWDWYVDIEVGRNYSQHGPNPLSASEIYAWTQLTKTDLTAFEYETIRQIDLAFIKAVSEYKQKVS